MSTGDQAARSSSGSYCMQVSDKHRVIILSDEDLNAPIKPEVIKILDKNTDSEPGVILPNGRINWNCPCLGGMPSGRCAVQFRAAFTCFHYSTSEIKGIECTQEFDKLQECMKKFPKLYGNKNDTKSTAFDKVDDN